MLLHWNTKSLSWLWLLDPAIFVWKFLGLIFIFFNVFRGVSDLRAIFSLDSLYCSNWIAQARGDAAARRGKRAAIFRLLLLPVRHLEAGYGAQLHPE